MKKITTALRCVYATQLLVAALILLVYEAGWLAPGLLAGDATTSYWMNMVGVVVTLLCILLALKLMNFKRVKAMIHADEQDYFVLSLVRIQLLGLPLLYNTFAYYLLSCEPTCGYLALMCVVAFFFIWPSEDKMLYERAIDEPKLEDSPKN